MMTTDLDPKFATYIRIKQQNPMIEWAGLSSSCCQWFYSDIARIQVQLLDNIEMIRDKRVLDLGCHDGVFTEAMCQCGAARVIGTNVRHDMIDLVNQTLTLSGKSQQAKVVFHDIYDLVGLETLCKGIDTVHLSGLIFHVNHHFALLWTLSQSLASSLIIDTVYSNDDWLDPRALQTWKTEDCCNPLFGHDQRTQPSGHAFVGTPNLAWYQSCLELLGWKIESAKNIAFMHFEDKLRRRAVLTCKKNS